MAQPARKRATYDDILRAPENMIAEIVDGDLYTSPRPAMRHSIAASVLGSDLGGPFHRGRGGPGGWWILDEPELHMGDNVLVPDLAGWRRERLPKVLDVVGMTLPPDWVCEVISPSTGRLDRTKKLPIYAHSGVSHAWMVDPQARTLEVFRREGTTWSLVQAFGGDDMVRADPFAAVELDLLALWGETRAD